MTTYMRPVGSTYWDEAAQGFVQIWETYERGAQLQRPTKAAEDREQRWRIWERDDFRCRRCGSRRFLTLDHITPRLHGGGGEDTNLQTLCRSCNSKKGAR